MFGLVRDGLEGLGLLCVMAFAILMLILWSDRHKHPTLISCSQCGYTDSESRVIDHENQDHPAAPVL